MPDKVVDASVVAAIAFDAAYLWVARELKCELLTFDERLARAARLG